MSTINLDTKLTKTHTHTHTHTLSLSLYTSGRETKCKGEWAVYFTQLAYNFVVSNTSMTGVSASYL